MKIKTRKSSYPEYIDYDRITIETHSSLIDFRFYAFKDWDFTFTKYEGLFSLIFEFPTFSLEITPL